MDNGIEIHYHKRQHTFSTSELRNRIYELEVAKRQEKNVVDIPQYAIHLTNTKLQSDK
jgi:hypothetical protein